MESHGKMLRQREFELRVIRWGNSARSVCSELGGKEVLSSRCGGGESRFT